MEDNTVTVEITKEQKASLEFIAFMMDEKHRRGALEVSGQLALQHLHGLLWRIKDAMKDND